MAYGVYRHRPVIVRRRPFVLSASAAAIDLTADNIIAGNTILESPNYETPQFLRPSSDILAGNWTPSTGVDLYPMIDEVAPDDNDYIISGSVPVNDIAQMSLSSGGTPSASYFHIARYRIEQVGNGSASLIFSLVESGSTRATWTEENIDQAVMSGSYMLSASEANSILDYSGLNLQVEATT